MPCLLRLRTSNMSNNSKAKIFLADSRQVGKLLSEKSVDLILTGPPYWNEVIYSDDDAQLSRINDYPQFLKAISEVWQGCSTVLKPGSIMAIWVHDLVRKIGGEYQYIPLHSDILSTFPKDLSLKNIYIWDRYLNRDRGEIPDRSGTRVQYVLIFQKEGTGLNDKKIGSSLQKLYWQPVWNKKTTPKFLGFKWLFRVLFSLAKSFNLRLPGSINKFKSTKVLKDEYIFRDYATECPQDISDLLIKLFSLPGDVILDPFAGSGTTLKSALDLGRQAVGIEINKNSSAAIQKKLSGRVTFHNFEWHLK